MRNLLSSDATETMQRLDDAYAVLRDPRSWLLVFGRLRPDGRWRATYGRTLGTRSWSPSATFNGFVAGSDGLVRLTVRPCGAEEIECEAVVDLVARTIRLGAAPATGGATKTGDRTVDAS